MLPPLKLTHGGCVRVQLALSPIAPRKSGINSFSEECRRSLRVVEY